MTGTPADGIPRAVELHPEHRRPLVRIRITDQRVGGPAAWQELRPYLVLWVTAGAAWVEVDGDVLPVDKLAAIDDYRDLLGARLVIVDETLAGDAAEVMRDEANR